MSAPPTLDVVPIFATPFGVVTLPAPQELNADLNTLFTARASEKWRDPRSPATARTFSSRDDLTEWEDEPVRQLIAAMLRGVSSVAASVSDLDGAQFAALPIEARAWFTIVGPDGCVPSTSYANTSWIGIYCVAAPAPAAARLDSGVLRMHESRLGTMFQDPASMAIRVPYRAGHYTWRPVVGQMAVFPAAITHEIALVRSSGALILVTARVRFAGTGESWMPPW
jgi:hypothetical protein